MARPAESYRGARRNAWRETDKPWTPLQFIPRENNRVPPEMRPLPAARYTPYRCKPPRIKFGTFQVGAQPDPVNDVQVPYTDLRKQPRVYR